MMLYLLKSKIVMDLLYDFLSFFWVVFHDFQIEYM